MKYLLLLLMVIVHIQANEIAESTVQDLFNKKRAQWVSLKGTVRFNDRGKLSIVDSTGEAAIKIRRSSYYTKDEFRKSLSEGDTISIIGTQHSFNNPPEVRLLLARKGNTTLFRQQFRNIPNDKFPDSLERNEINDLTYLYRKSYRNKATTNLIIGGTAAMVSSMFYISMLTYEPDTSGFFPDFTGVLYFFVGAGFSVTTIRHMTAFGLFDRRRKLAPEVDYKDNPITFDLQVRPQREHVGLYLVGKF